MRLPEFSPRTTHRFAVASLVLLTLIVFSGAAVRLTGSGLACPSWPQCNDQIINAETPQWIEFGNRLVSGIIGMVAIATFFITLRRKPRDRQLVRLAAVPAVGVAAQAILGALTVYHDLRPEYVIAHFLLSFLILIGTAFLVWRSSNPAGSRPYATDRISVWGVRALLPLVTAIVVIGTFATGAGPHPGARATDGVEVAPRIDWFGGDTLHTLILRHGHLGTATLVFTTLLLLVLWRRRAPVRLLRRVALVLPFYGIQGAVGLYQYYNGLPAGAVWVHVVFATIVWVLVLFAVFEAGRLEPRARASRQTADAQPQS